MISQSVPLLFVQQKKSTLIYSKELFTLPISFLCLNFTFQHHLFTLEPFVNCIGYPEPVSVELVEDIINHGTISWIMG